MRITIVGQRDFGKAVLDAFLDRGDTVAGVFCAPEKPGATADPLRLAAEQRQIPLHQFGSLKTEEARRAVAYTRYPPEGVRGVAAIHRGSRYGRAPDYLKRAGEQIAVVWQLEAPAAGSLPRARPRS